MLKIIAGRSNSSLALVAVDLRRIQVPISEISVTAIGREQPFTHNATEWPLSVKEDTQTATQKSARRFGLLNFPYPPESSRWATIGLRSCY